MHEVTLARHYQVTVLQLDDERTALHCTVMEFLSRVTPSV